MDPVAIEFSGAQLHRVMCRALLGQEEDYGTKSLVAEKLGIVPQQYSRVINRADLAVVTVSRWLTRAPGVVMTQKGNRVEFSYDPSGLTAAGEPALVLRDGA